MLDGWYCRSMANEQATDERDEDSDDSEEGQEQGDSDNKQNTMDYKTQYRYLKRKFKFLIYENEFFQDALRINQRRLLKVNRDRAFLLDRLLQYEKPENSSSDSEATESSEDESKKRKLDQQTSNGNNNNANGSSSNRGRKKKLKLDQNMEMSTISINDSTSAGMSNKSVSTLAHHSSGFQQSHMTAAEVEQHLQSRQTLLHHGLPQSTSVPPEMFSNESSESNVLIDGSSPSHVAAEECV